MSDDNFPRPPIGFVVEGDGEYYGYPSLVHKIVGVPGFKVPCVNAGGYGGIYKNLSKYLTNLVIAYKPHHVIITIDLLDVIKDGFVQNGSELVTHLVAQVSSWQENDAQTDTRLTPLPERISVVLQVQKFESWLLSDGLSLVKAGHIVDTFSVDASFFKNSLGNTDESIPKPAIWLAKHKTSSRDIKNSKYVKKLIASLNPETMQENSRSFRKFYKEVSLSYADWCKVCGFS